MPEEEQKPSVDDLLDGQGHFNSGSAGLTTGTVSGVPSEILDRDAKRQERKPSPVATKVLLTALMTVANMTFDDLYRDDENIEDVPVD